MPLINIDGNPLEIDIMSEVGLFTWVKPKWTTDKLIAASPFRYDRTPSFFVNLESGGWADSGAYDADYESGNLAKLLAFLRDETYEETVDYLIELYGRHEERKDGKVSIPPINLRKHTERVELDRSTLTPYAYRHPYLTKRGINEKTQRFAGIGYDRRNKAVTIPWYHADGTLANVKFRKILGKTFWYISGAAPIRSLVYGIDKVYKHNLKEVVICEAEIDALSWYSVGVPAIALGGTAVTETQLDLIRKSPIETLILAMDNDKPGGKMERQLIRGLSGVMTLQEVKIPAEHKDANDALVAGVDLKNLVRRNFHYVFDWNV